MFHPASFSALLRHRRTLLLQGPMGPFFARLAAYLRDNGQDVFKVNFNGGDRLFYRSLGAVTYQGRHDDWAQWLRRFVIDNHIQAIVLFGQTRPVHQPVADIASQLGVELFVFEEGYDRPNHVTLEIGGVNAYSPMPRERAVYDAIPASVLPSHRRPVPTGQSFWRAARCALAYGLAKALCAWRHPFEVYHRSLHPVCEIAKWLHGGLRKLRNLLPDRAVMRELVSSGRSGRWFLLPLQVHNDSQILRHSHYAGMEAVIDEVMASFAEHADADDWLVIKHHPMDRAYRNYAPYIREQSRRLGISERVRYIHDLHMPTLLTHTRGMVTVNSTTGLQALHHGKPVVALGECFYAVNGLTYPGALTSFWRDPGSVDMQLFYRFRHHLIEQNQLNGSFYARVPAFAQPPQGLPQWQTQAQAQMQVQTQAQPQMSTAWKLPAAPQPPAKPGPAQPAFAHWHTPAPRWQHRALLPVHRQPLARPAVSMRAERRAKELVH